MDCPRPFFLEKTDHFELQELLGVVVAVPVFPCMLGFEKPELIMAESILGTMAQSVYLLGMSAPPCPKNRNNAACFSFVALDSPEPGVAHVVKTGKVQKNNQGAKFFIYLKL